MGFLSFFQLYEIYYHLGVAYQHLKNPRKSAESFTNAISAVSAPKVSLGFYIKRHTFD